MKKIIKKFFTPFAVFAMALGIGVSLSAPKEVLRTKAAPVLYNSFNFKDGGDSQNSAYNSTNIATKVSYASDNPGGTSGTTDWEADYANLSMTTETRLGGKLASTVQTNDTTPWANIKTKFTFPVPIEQVEIIEVGTFGTASNVENVYLQSSLDSETWTTIGSTANKSGSVTFSDLTVPANSYLRLGVGLTASSKNSGLKFTGIKVYENENAVTKALTSISASGTPTKTSYYDGDTFDPNGLTITAAFDDGSSADVTSLATFSPNPLTVGTTSVTASYSFGDVTKTTVISGITVQVADFSDVKYEITGKNTFSTIGRAPTGSSATLVETYSTSKQITGGNSQTVTLTGYNNVRITQITLSAKSNTSKGAGNFQYSLDGGATYEDIIPTSNFNNSNWYGAWSTSYVDVVKDVNIIVSSSSVILKVNATVSSLYVESYSIRWEESEPDALESLTMNKTESAILVGRTEQFGVTPTPATAPAEVTWSSNNETVATVDSTGLVTAHSVGTATITATSVSNTTISASVVITVPSLDTIEIEGDMTRKSYYTIDSWDITGLTVTAMYSNTDIHDIPNEDVTWTFNPAAPNSTSITSVEVTATYEGISDSKVINVTVTEKVSTVVISEVYGGGGNSGAPYRNDFVELYNNTDINIDISGWTVHYASATGDFNNKTTLPDNSIILPYSYYLVKWAAGSSTTVPELPTADVEGSVFAGATNLKVALTNNDTAPNSPTDTNVVDYVGAGNATAYEGAVAPGPSNSESISRTKSGNIYVDTDNNSADFTVGAPTPMNSALSIAEKLMETDTEMQCVTKFPEMKALVVQLSEGQLEYFQSTGDETLMVNARARYLAWAAYLGDNDAYGNGTGSTARSTTTNSSSNNVAAIALIGVIGITSLVGYYFINKKRLTA